MKSVTMATKREMSDYTVFFSVLGHKKFIHKILAKSESVRFQPLFKFFWCSRRIALNIWNFNVSLTNDVVSFEQLGPVLQVTILARTKMLPVTTIA